MSPSVELGRYAVGTELRETDQGPYVRRYLMLVGRDPDERSGEYPSIQLTFGAAPETSTDRAGDTAGGGQLVTSSSDWRLHFRLDLAEFNLYYDIVRSESPVYIDYETESEPVEGDTTTAHVEMIYLHTGGERVGEGSTDSSPYEY